MGVPRAVRRWESQARGLPSKCLKPSHMTGLVGKLPLLHHCTGILTPHRDTPIAQRGCYGTEMLPPLRDASTTQGCAYHIEMLPPHKDAPVVLDQTHNGHQHQQQSRPRYLNLYPLQRQPPPPAEHPRLPFPIINCRAIPPLLWCSLQWWSLVNIWVLAAKDSG